MSVQVVRFFYVLWPYFSMLILSLPLLGLGSKSTALTPVFCVRRPVQYDTVAVESHFWVVCFFSGELFGWMESINMAGVFRKQGMLTQGPGPEPECILNISSFLTLPHLLDCLICTKNSLSIVFLL